MTRPDMSLAVRLSAPTVPYAVDVSLRSFGDRWVGVAQLAEHREVGVGTTARQALTASLAPLGDRARAILLADTALLAPSAVLANERAR